MLSFSTRAITAGAIPVNGLLEADDAVWLESDRRPTDPVHVTGRLSAAGAGRFYFSGRMAGASAGECRRCLVPVSTNMAAESHFIFCDAEAEDEDAGDPDVYALQAGRSGLEVDLRPAIREQFLLEVPAFVLCRPDCKGLCPTCGINLNQGACSHAPLT